jgi:hypothetical protein
MSVTDSSGARQTDIAYVYAGEPFSVHIESVIYGSGTGRYWTLSVFYGDNSRDDAPRGDYWPYDTTHTYAYPGSYTMYTQSEHQIGNCVWSINTITVIVNGNWQNNFFLTIWFEIQGVKFILDYFEIA